MIADWRLTKLETTESDLILTAATITQFDLEYSAIS